jgi:hypothetical protein
MVTRRQELAQNRRRSPAGLTADPCPLCNTARKRFLVGRVAG